MATYQKHKNTRLSDNFVSLEFDCKGAGCCKETKINPQLVQYLQAIRNHFGKSIVITSGYRCSKHNIAVGGASNSRHLYGDAADIIVNGVAPLEVAKFAESIGVKGIGLYSTFTHIDTREKKSFWYGENEEKRETFGGSVSNSPTNSELATVSKITVSLPTLQKGSNGAFVKIAQALLLISADGDFGKDTKKAVEQFQKKRNIKQDGIIGETTWKALFS